jgi:hypothetical protein
MHSGHLGKMQLVGYCSYPFKDRVGTNVPWGQLSTDFEYACATDQGNFKIHEVKCPDPLELIRDTITSPRRLVTTFLTSNSTEFK